MIWKLTNLSHGAQKWFKLYETTWFNNITNFIRLKIICIVFLNIFVILNIILHVLYFWHKYTLTSHIMISKSLFFIQLMFLSYGLPYYAKTLWKFLLMLTWLKFKNNTFKNIVFVMILYMGFHSVFSTSCKTFWRWLIILKGDDIGSSLIWGLLLWHFNFFLDCYIL